MSSSLNSLTFRIISYSRVSSIRSEIRFKVGTLILNSFSDDKKEAPKPDKEETVPKADPPSSKPPSCMEEEPMEEGIDGSPHNENSDIPGEEPMEDALTSVPSSPSGVNRRTSVLFTKKAGALFKVR